MTRRRVLIVEDDLLQTKIFEKIVNKIDIKACCASTGEEALKFLEEHHDIGLVLLDLALPDISGLQVLERLQKKKNQVPVAILSANEESRIALMAGKLGAVDFFIKGKSGNNNEELVRLMEFVDKTMRA